jgi:hypothetical protein
MVLAIMTDILADSKDNPWLVKLHIMSGEYRLLPDQPFQLLRDPTPVMGILKSLTATNVPGKNTKVRTPIAV